MTEVDFVETCEAPVEVAFEYLADYRHVTEYWYGMTKFQPVGALDRGLGAEYESAMKLGPTTLKSTVRTVCWEPNSRLAYESVSGMRSSTTFELAPAGDRRSTVRLRIEFELPGGVLGRAMAQTLEPVVSTAANKTAQGLSRGITAYYTSAGRRAQA